MMTFDSQLVVMKNNHNIQKINLNYSNILICIMIGWLVSKECSCIIMSHMRTITAIIMRIILLR